jgi:hypothetical protein
MEGMPPPPMPTVYDVRQTRSPAAEKAQANHEDTRERSKRSSGSGRRRHHKRRGVRKRHGHDEEPVPAVDPMRLLSLLSDSAGPR